MSDNGWWRNALGSTFKEILTFLKIPSNAGALTPHWLIGSKIPAVLVTFYGSNSTPFNVITCMQFFDNAGNYQYLAWLFAPTTHEIVWAVGNVNSGSVSESMFLDFDPSTATPREMIFGDAFGARADGMQWTFQGVVGAILDNSLSQYSNILIKPGVDLTIDNHSMHRGNGFMIPIPGTSGGAVVPAGLSAASTNFTFRAERGYAISWSFSYSLSGATNVMGCDVRINGVTFKCGSTSPTGGVTTFHPSQYNLRYFDNTGSDKGPYLVELVLSTDVGTGDLLTLDSAHAQFFKCEDVGGAGHYNNSGSYFIS